MYTYRLNEISTSCLSILILQWQNSSILTFFHKNWWQLRINILQLLRTNTIVYLLTLYEYNCLSTKFVRGWPFNANSKSLTLYLIQQKNLSATEFSYKNAQLFLVEYFPCTYNFGLLLTFFFSLQPHDEHLSIMLVVIVLIFILCNTSR